MSLNLLAASLREYETRTGIALLEHPLAEKLRYSDTPESVTAILQEQVPVYGESGGNNRIVKSFSSVVPVLCTLSVSLDLNWVRSSMPIGFFHL